MRTSFLERAVFLVWLSGAALVSAQDAQKGLEDQINALQQIITHDLPGAPETSAASTNTPSSVPPANPGPTITTEMPPQFRALRYYYALRQDFARKDFTNAINVANNLNAADPSPEMQSAIGAIVPQLQKLKDAQDAGASAQLKSALDRATQAVISAKDPKDLDPVLSELGAAIDQSRSGTYGGLRQTAYLQLESASRFVKEWQSYLVDQAAGNSMQAANDLRNLANMSDTFMPIPRSEILARSLKVAGTATTTQAVADSKIEVHSFDDLPAAINQLQLLQRGGNYSMEMNGLMNSMQNLENAYHAYQDKNYTGALQQLQNYSFGVSMGGVVSGVAGTPDKTDTHGSLREEITALKDTLLVEVVQGLLAMPDAPAPQKDEHAQDYLLRLAGLEESAADWTGLQQVLTVYQQAAGFAGPQAWLQEDLTGLRAYLVGEKLESAGQTLDAIRSYRESLATLGRFFPAEPPAAKLKELEKNHPDLYQKALLLPISVKGP
jgi:hypothetical protein